MRFNNNMINFSSFSAAFLYKNSNLSSSSSQLSERIILGYSAALTIFQTKSVGIIKIFLN